MIAKQHLSVLLTFILGLVSAPAMAHSGEHSHSLMVWLQHMLASSFHLLSLLGLAIILAIATTIWRWLRNPVRPADNTQGAD